MSFIIYNIRKCCVCALADKSATPHPRLSLIFSDILSLLIHQYTYIYNYNLLLIIIMCNIIKYAYLSIIAGFSRGNCRKFSWILSLAWLYSSRYSSMAVFMASALISARLSQQKKDFTEENEDIVGYVSGMDIYIYTHYMYILHIYIYIYTHYIHTIYILYIYIYVYAV